MDHDYLITYFSSLCNCEMIYKSIGIFLPIVELAVKRCLEFINLFYKYRFLGRIFKIKTFRESVKKLESQSEIQKSHLKFLNLLC